ncbi:TPA: membrane protein insertion efficiency factor YidD [bacterium]|nr:membrane protein insertion efficiency factor YidD [bacterium]
MKLFLLAIRFYQKTISPFLGRNCRFYPSCSEYAYTAIKKYGAKGILLAVKRLLSCHPFSPGGIDKC